MELNVRIVIILSVLLVLVLIILVIELVIIAVRLVMLMHLVKVVKMDFFCKTRIVLSVIILYVLLAIHHPLIA